jgi:hypothetical protein
MPAKTLQDVISAFPSAILDKYDFSNAVYESALKPIEGIVCPKHGVFRQYAAQLRKQGAGCPQCGEEQRVKSRRMSADDFLARCKEVHGDKYDYAKTDYVNMKTKVVVTCSKHGDFSISPIKHIHSGQGCPDCGAARRGRRSSCGVSAKRTAATKIRMFAADYERTARDVHGDKYLYDKSKYAGMRRKIIITCPEHGDFEQVAGKHIYHKQGCPRCSHHASNAEAGVFSFLQAFTRAESRDRTVIRPKELDIYLPDSQLAVEYCGMYWHSHGTIDDEQQNKHKHYTKHRLCADKGVRLITVYEDEWVNRQFAVKRLLRNAIGKNKGKLMARKCDLEKVSHQDAVSFYERYHPQGGAGAGENYGLYWKGKLVACMRFTKGANDRGNVKNRDWTLTRYATRVTVSGGASRLFKAFVREFSPQKIKSFSDNRYFSGAMYEQLGFQLDQESAPDYAVWHQRLGLLPKSAWQRRSIPARAKELGVDAKFDPETDPRTEREMTYLLGARRIFDCGKKRWVWTA